MSESEPGTVRRRLIEASERVNPIQPVHLWRTPVSATVDLLIVTHVSVYTEIHEHAIGALPNETGGFLLGWVGYDEWARAWHVEIDEAIALDPIEKHPTFFEFSWRDVDRVRRHRETHGKALVGWYHTHPNFGVFLSDTDMDRTHRVLFTEAFQVALVYDPTRGRAGYFFWEGPNQIDTTQAPWREFGVAVASDAQDTEAGAVPSAPSAQPVRRRLTETTDAPEVIERGDAL